MWPSEQASMGLVSRSGHINYEGEDKVKQCAYLKCQMFFKPGRANQKYHSGRCRELAKKNKHALVRVHKDEVTPVRSFLARERARRRGVTPHPGDELRLIRDAAVWLKNRMNLQAA